MTNDLEVSERMIREFASIDGITSNCTVIVIPHDIDQDTLVMVGEKASRQKFNGLALQGVLREAEQRRLQGVYQKTMDRIKDGLNEVISNGLRRVIGLDEEASSARH